MNLRIYLVTLPAKQRWRLKKISSLSPILLSALLTRDLDAPVGGASQIRIVVGDRFGFAVAFRSDLVRRHAMRDQPRGDRLRAAFRQHLSRRHAGLADVVD